MLEQTENIKEMIIRPQNPQRRVIAQKSVFLQPPKGFIDVPKNKRVPYSIHPQTRIANVFAASTMAFLLKTIYNDIHGFIRNQNIQRNAYIQFYMGMTFQYEGYNAETNEESKGHYEKAIKYYDQVIDLNPEMSIAYHNRGECWLHLGTWNKAKENFTISKSMGVDTIYGFRVDYENVGRV